MKNFFLKKLLIIKEFPEKSESYYEDIILNRSNILCFYCKNLLKPESLSSHPRLGNLNETRNASSPGFFLKMLESIFRSIYQSVSHKLFLQILTIGFCLFCSKIEKRQK